MIQVSITTLKKMTASTLISRLPFEVTYNSKVIAVCFSPSVETSRLLTEKGDMLTTGTDYLTR